MTTDQIKFFVKANLVAAVLVSIPIAINYRAFKRMEKKAQEMQARIDNDRNTPWYENFSPDAKRVLFGRNV